jgi:hypothetical protein
MYVALLLAGVPQIGIASDIDSIEPGHWMEVPNSKLRSVGPNPVPKGNLENVIEGWSGGSYDTLRDRLIVWGGGHADYAGNEIYVFDLESLSWTRLTDPSSNIGGAPESGVYPDGLPRSRHTYDYIEYVEAVDLFCSFGGAALYPSGNIGTIRTDCFDFKSNEWKRMADMPETSGKINSNSVYDPVTGRVFYKNNRSVKVRSYDARNNRWSEVGKPFPKTGGLTADIDPGRRLMVFLGKGSTYTWHLEKHDFKQLSTTGSGPSKNAPGLTYDSVSDRMVAWQGGGNVYTLDLDTNTWQVHKPATGNTVVPPQQTNNGTFGRFRYIPSRNLFILVNGVDENVFLYRLSPGSGETSRPAVPGSPSDLDAKVE